MASTTNNRNMYLDYIKGLTCICVVFIHCQFPGTFGVLIGGIIKFAVPIFFMVSGYYAAKNNTYHAKRKIVNIIKLAVTSELLYLCFELIKIVAKSESVVEYLKEEFSVVSIVSLLIFNKPITSSHLWFLYALIYCYITLWIFRKLTLPKHLLNTFVIIGHVVFLMLGEGLTLLGHPCQFDVNILDFSYSFTPYNLFLFRALPYFLMGYIFREQNIRISAGSKYRALAYIGLILSVIERVYLGWFQFYLGTIPVATILFLWAVEKQERTIENILMKKIMIIGKEHSDFIYIIHLLVASVVLIISKHVKLGIYGIVFDYAYPFIVLGISLFMSILKSNSRLFLKDGD